MNAPFFSIVVPVYNVEGYVEKCVRSILAQSFGCYEVILVNDGSKDNSGAICDRLSAENPMRVKVIHKPNGGLSDARNVGIDAAKGEYVIFVDSDDYWDDSNALCQIKEKLSAQPDILFFGCKDYYCNKGTIVVGRYNYDEDILECGDKDRIVGYLVQSGAYPGAAWLCAVRRDFLLKNALYFIKGLKSEDIDWMFNVFIHAKSFAALNNPFYVYLKNRSGSITSTTNTKTVDDLFYIVAKWSKKLHSFNEPYAKYLLGHLSYCYMMLLINYAQMPRHIRKMKRKDIESEMRLLDYASGVKLKVFAHIIKMVGVGIGSSLLLYTYKMTH